MERRRSSDNVSAALKDADSTWTVSQEKPFQLRNRSGHQLDVVMAEALLDGYPQRDPVRALPTRGQELLLGGTPVTQVVIDTLGNPACLVVPDPRHFALHKLYPPLAHDRGIKQAKDRAQAKAVLNLLAGHLPHYPLDDAFRTERPSELGEQLAQWKKATCRRAARPRRAGKPLHSNEWTGWCLSAPRASKETGCRRPRK